MNKNTLYFEHSSIPNFGTIGITVSMWKRHDFEDIRIFNNVMNIQDAIGKGFGY